MTGMVARETLRQLRRGGLAHVQRDAPRSAAEQTRPNAAELPVESTRCVGARFVFPHRVPELAERGGR